MATLYHYTTKGNEICKDQLIRTELDSKLPGHHGRYDEETMTHIDRKMDFVWLTSSTKIPGCIQNIIKSVYKIGLVHGDKFDYDWHKLGQYVESQPAHNQPLYYTRFQFDSSDICARTWNYEFNTVWNKSKLRRAFAETVNHFTKINGDDIDEHWITDKPINLKDHASTKIAYVSRSYADIIEDLGFESMGQALERAHRITTAPATHKKVNFKGKRNYV